MTDITSTTRISMKHLSLLALTLLAAISMSFAPPQESAPSTPRFVASSAFSGTTVQIGTSAFVLYDPQGGTSVFDLLEPTVEGSTMVAEWKWTDPDDGATITIRVITPPSPSSSASATAKKHKAAVKAMKLEFPPDPTEAP